MSLDENIKNEIVNRITANLKVKDVILFGSYAYGKPHKDSDIDVIVVLDEHGFPKNFREKINRRLKVSTLLFTMQQRFPMDIFVYTKDEWNKAIELNSSFIREVNLKGIRLL